MRSDGLSLTTTTTEGNSSLAVITNIYIGRGESNHLKDIGKTGLAMVKSLEIQVSGIRSFVVAVFNRYFILVRYKWKEERGVTVGEKASLVREH